MPGIPPIAIILLHIVTAIILIIGSAGHFYTLKRSLKVEKDTRAAYEKLGRPKPPSKWRLYTGHSPNGKNVAGVKEYGWSVNTDLHGYLGLLMVGLMSVGLALAEIGLALPFVHTLDAVKGTFLMPLAIGCIGVVTIGVCADLSIAAAFLEIIFAFIWAIVITFQIKTGGGAVKE